MTTPSETLLAERRQDLDTLVRLVATVEMAQRLAERTFADRDSALEARDELLGLIDDIAESADRATYGQLRQIRAAIVEHVAGLSGELPQVVTASPSAVLPSLTLSYAIYGDLDRAADIADRNRLSRPGFVPARPIRVLTE